MSGRSRSASLRWPRRSKSGYSRHVPARKPIWSAKPSVESYGTRHRPWVRSCAGQPCRGWPISVNRPGCASGATRCARRANSSPRTTRSSAGSPRRRGHRSLGRAVAPHSHRAGLGYDHFEVIVDDRSRRSVVVQVPGESGASAAALAQAIGVFAAGGIVVERPSPTTASPIRRAPTETRDPPSRRNPLTPNARLAMGYDQQPPDSRRLNLWVPKNRRPPSVDRPISPIVTVITPTFNHAPFIGRCLTSVLEQTECRWEQIVVDDGSTDGTAEIVRHFADRRIRYVPGITGDCGSRRRVQPGTEHGARRADRRSRG